MTNLLSRFSSAPILKNISAHLTRSDLWRRLSSGVFWVLVGTSTWRVLNAITTIFVARILGPQVYGEFGLIMSTVRMISIYARFGLGPTTTKYVAEFREKDPLRANRILQLTLFLSFFLCSSVSIVLLTGSVFFAKNILGNHELALGLGIGAIMLFFLAYGETKQNALTGFESFRSIAIVNIIRGVSTPLACIPLAIYWGMPGALTGLAIVTALMLASSSYFLRKTTQGAGFSSKISLLERFRELPVLWHYALPGVLTGMVITVMMWTGRLLMTKQEAGYTQLGLFEAAFQWQTLILFLPSIFLQVVFPMLSETYSRSNRDDFHSVLSIQMQAILLITLPIVVMTITLSEVVASLYGAAYEGTGEVISVLMLAVFISSLSMGLQSVYDGTGRRWTNLGMYSIWAVVYISCAMTLIPAMGALGYAFTHLAADTTLFLIQALYVDIVIAPTILRRHGKLMAYAMLLCILCYLVKIAFTGITAYLLAGIIFLLALTPLAIKIGLRKKLSV